MISNPSFEASVISSYLKVNLEISVKVKSKVTFTKPGIIYRNSGISLLEQH